MVDAIRKHLGSVNAHNFYAFLYAALRRDDLYKRVEAAAPRCHTLIVTGHGSIHINQIEELNGLLSGGKASFLKLFGCGNIVTEERPGHVLQSFVLFLQGLGLGASIVVKLHDLSRTTLQDA
eukprot:m.86147 g.86147  ORF g.86147 m.86147 type:complete len:122 (+) comp14454_c0_seq1:916-1281(+)